MAPMNRQGGFKKKGFQNKPKPGQGERSNDGQEKAHLLQFGINDDNERLYTLRKFREGEATKSSHPAGFNPEDPHAVHRYHYKRRIGLVPSKEQRTRKAAAEKAAGAKKHDQSAIIARATENKAKVLNYLEHHTSFKTYAESALNDKVENILELPNTFPAVAQLCTLLQGHHELRQQPELDYPFHDPGSQQKEQKWDADMKNAAREAKAAADATSEEAKAERKTREGKGDAKAGAKRKRSSEKL